MRKFAPPSQAEPVGRVGLVQRSRTHQCCRAACAGSIPESIGNLINLGNCGGGFCPLDLSNNKLTGVYFRVERTGRTSWQNRRPPPALDLTLRALVPLVCTQPPPGTIPESIGNLTNLIWLSLYNNKLTGR